MRANPGYLIGQIASQLYVRIEAQSQIDAALPAWIV